jgi:hypothetical protein
MDFPKVIQSVPIDPSIGRPLIVGPSLGSYGFSTIQEAVNSAGAGMTIVVMPGEYEENVVITTDYITIEGGVEGGYGRPDIVSTTGVTLTVSAQGFVARKCRFVTSDTDAVVQEGNGFKYEDCVFDGGNSEGAADGLVRLKGNADDDGMTASEGEIVNCLFRGSIGRGLVFDTGDAPGNGVGSTHCVVKNCRFIDNVDSDITTDDTGLGTYSVQDVLIDGCMFMEPKNKANWIDVTTDNAGAASDQTGMISNCYFNDDTIDTTAVAIVGSGFGVVGCHSMDGEFDGSGLD